MLKENKGVTLVALVITIIVLLILAGVSIAMVVGDNGILNQAVNASTRTVGSSVKEDLSSAVSGIQSDFLSAKFSGTGTVEKFKNYIDTARVSKYMGEKYDVELTDDTDGCTIKVQYKKVLYIAECKWTENQAGMIMKEFYSVATIEPKDTDENYVELDSGRAQLIPVDKDEKPLAEGAAYLKIADF